MKLFCVCPPYGGKKELALANLVDVPVLDSSFGPIC